MAAVTALAGGGVLLGGAMTASASGGTISFPSTGAVGSGFTPVTVTASGFTAKSSGLLTECSTATPAGGGQQPTVTTSFTGSTPIPVSCTTGTPQKTNKKGGFSLFFTIQPGSGPPELGVPDSAGNDPSVDAPNYPCPPTAAQQAAGATCVVAYYDAAGETGSQAIDFNYNSSPPTTLAPTSCMGQPNTVTSGAASVTVTPATCLQGGQVVTVTGSGLNPSDLGGLLECNTATPQPTAWNNTAGEAIPVGCSNPLSAIASTTAGGTISAKFTIVIGTVGPPGTDSNPGATDTPAQAAIDAAKFPCPPAGSTDGTGCAISYGDQAPTGGKADVVVVPITFNVNNLGTNSTTTTAGATKAASAKSSTTKTSSGSLAFTGAGPGLWIIGLTGLALIVLGGSLLVVVDAPRRLLMAVALRTGRRRRDDT